ncbi:DUF4350 domain-containing protein [Candidatus Bathyarchaeota archaeon]|nr:DUF4350 domain-containing protein [Candidatus Bathyarchaeota archaeon]
MRNSREFLVGGLAFLVFAVAVTLYYPPVDDLFVGTPYWNGLSELYNEIEPIRVHNSEDYRLIDASNSTLFIIGPSRDFVQEDMDAVIGFLISGGKVVLADDFGTGNQLLGGLGLDIRFTGELLVDPVFFDTIPEYPRLLNFSSSDVGDVVLNYATTLTSDVKLRVLEFSSPLSYYNNSDGVESGTFPVLGNIKLGRGNLYLLSDSSVFLNTMIGNEGNRDLLVSLANGNIYIDTSYSIPTRLLGVKWLVRDFYSVFNRSEVLYASLVLVSLLIVRLNSDENDGMVVDEVEELLKHHSEWDRELITWLQVQRSNNDGN